MSDAPLIYFIVHHNIIEVAITPFLGKIAFGTVYARPEEPLT
jgi:hypothetical protein